MSGLEKSWNGDIALATLQPAPVFPELYAPLWLYSGSYVSLGTSTVGPGAYVQKGATTTFPNTAGSRTSLFVLNANTPTSTQFAFESAIWSSTSGTSSIAELYDVTTSTAVTASQISTASTTATVIRSNKFTLTPGHTYAITYWGTTSNTVYLTDASLIIFPSSPLTSPSVSAISLANPSGNALKEAYIPLWVYSSGTVSTTSTSGVYLQKGSTSTVASTSSATNYVLSSSWNPNQLFALEASIWSSSASYTTYARLYDVTASNSYPAISTSSTTATVLRTSSFKAVPGHTYAVQIWTSGGTAYLTKAHLVALA